MVINFDPTRVVVGPPSGRLDRHDAEARQNRWMLELERGTQLAGARHEPNVEHAAGRPAQAVSRCPPVPISIQSTCKADTRGAEPTSPQQDASFAPAGHHLAAGSTPQDTAVAEPSTNGWRWHGAGTRPPLVAALAPMEIGVLLPQSVTMAPTSQLPAAAAQVDVVPPAQTSAPVEQVPGLNGSLLLPDSTPPGVTTVGVGPQAPENAEPSVPSGETAEWAPSGVPAATGGTEAFEKRLMHMLVKPDGVHAFIRDAELGAAQMRGVALMLSGELASAGQSLAALTVNGRTIEAHVVAFHDIVALPGHERKAQPAASECTRHSVTPVWKGNPQ